MVMFPHTFYASSAIMLTLTAAQEIEKLRQEAQALKNIRESMGTESFPQLLFDKVFRDDIARLKSMEEMWKTRRPPQTIDYSSTIQEAASALTKKDEILKAGQRVWDLQENVVVFKDRYMEHNCPVRC
jgi:ubiquitin-like 1-activating enzyme E1 B